MSSEKSLLLNFAKKHSFFKKIYFFYNIYIRNLKFLFNGSQFNEDKKIKSLFENNFKGKYLDIGCYHPTKVNNTLSLYRNGWHGMNIDLNHFTIELFKYARPKDINVCAALSSRKEKKKLYFLGDLDPKNTLDFYHIKWLKKYFNVLSKDIKTKIIKTTKLQDLLNKYNFKKIDFLNIDIEGHEAEVLKNFNFDKYRVKVICIEILDYNKSKKRKIISFLKKRGFSLRKKFTVNYIFEKNK